MMFLKWNVYCLVDLRAHNYILMVIIAYHGKTNNQESFSLDSKMNESFSQLYQLIFP